jgi:hypothetical protein
MKSRKESDTGKGRASTRERETDRHKRVGSSESECIRSKKAGYEVVHGLRKRTSNHKREIDRKMSV